MKTRGLQPNGNFSHQGVSVGLHRVWPLHIEPFLSKNMCSLTDTSWYVVSASAVSVFLHETYQAKCVRRQVCRQLLLPALSPHCYGLGLPRGCIPHAQAPHPIPSVQKWQKRSPAWKDASMERLACREAQGKPKGMPQTPCRLAVWLPVRLASQQPCRPYGPPWCAVAWLPACPASLPRLVPGWAPGRLAAWPPGRLAAWLPAGRTRLGSILGPATVRRPLPAGRPLPFLLLDAPWWRKAWLPGCLAAWLPWLLLAAWLPSCLAAWLAGCLAAMLPGFKAPLLHGCLATWATWAVWAARAAWPLVWPASR